MIIAVVTNENSLKGKVKGCFGKSGYIFVANTETKEVKIIDNLNFARLKMGSGIKTANMLLRIKVDVVVTEKIGLEALEMLKNGKVKVYSNASGEVVEVLDHIYLGGVFEEANPSRCAND